MAHKTVQLIIGRILTDEELREKFLVAPVETLSAFRDSGMELTDAEIEALVSTDVDWWRSGADKIDARLQGCALRKRATST
jgi:hypothetical protein